MKEEIKVPSVGESITTGTVAAWLRQDGDLVKEGEKLFELETDKALIEVPCPGTGVLKIEVAEGTEVEIGQTVATLVDTDASVSSAGRGGGGGGRGGGGGATGQRNRPPPDSAPVSGCETGGGRA